MEEMLVDSLEYHGGDVTLINCKLGWSIGVETSLQCDDFLSWSWCSHGGVILKSYE